MSVLAEVVGGRLDPPDAEVAVDDVTHDSRQSGPGALFVAIRGGTADGHDHIAEAVARGAVAVAIERRLDAGVPALLVDDTRVALGPLASMVHGEPSSAMQVIGVTGTNGKTTVTHNIESMAMRAGLPTGLLGTIETRIDGVGARSLRTTPEASDFQRLLARMRDAGCRLVAAEVSSHALALHRVASTRFEVAAFTNLSQDHLDFHGTMDDYLAAKRRLFTDYEVGTAVINVDDPAGEDIAGSYTGPLVRVGTGADVWAKDVSMSGSSARFELHTPWGNRKVDAPVFGEPNLDNAVLAAACLLAAGVRLDAVVSGLAELAGVPGRFEVVSGDDPVLVVVDYAHTPVAISHAVTTAQQTTDGKVIAVLGAGGDRDREKRPLMGRAASRADLVVVTSDNPRSEDAGDIAEKVREGVEGTDLLVEIDRRKAIAAALGAASSGDIVLVLGRGHEPEQEISGTRVEFDDRLVAREELIRLRRSQASGAPGGMMSR